jgi:general secretion pathway protein E
LGDDDARAERHHPGDGPDGLGKTTTLYSTLKGLSTPEVNVCSVEDPIEMIEPAFNQMQVQPAIGVDFASGVRTLLRQDPDIIMVGRNRDRDTADMAVQAGAHRSPRAVDAAHQRRAHGGDAPARPRHAFVPPQLDAARRDGAAAGAHAVSAVQAAGEPPDEETWRSLTAPWKGEKPAQVMRPVGCLECRMTGYYGRMGIYEVMLVTPALRRLITREADDRAIREQAFKDGMKPLRVSGAMKIAAGLTTADEVMKVAPLA